VDDEDEAFRWKDLANANTGSCSMIPRKSSSIEFWSVPVRAKRGRNSPDVPDS
jgi:hypothetical protein